MHNNMII